MADGEDPARCTRYIAALTPIGDAIECTGNVRGVNWELDRGSISNILADGGERKAERG